MTSPQQQIAAQIRSDKSLNVSPTWLDNFISSSQRNVPISALTRTAIFRILASDFRDSLTTTTPSSLLPVDIFDPTVKEKQIQGPIALQVVDIEDIGTSLWSQVEAIERVERGEAIRGREIIRTVNVGEDSEERANNNNAAISGIHNSSTTSNGPHRLILQDAAGTRAVAIEIKRVNEIAVGKLPIGAKLLVRNATVARGMVLLSPDCVTVLGGKIDAMDRVWTEGRKARLLTRINEANGETQQNRNGDAMEE